MQITVFGATGKVGTYVVRELLDKGYIVVAFVHGSHQFADNKNLHIVKGDIYNAKDVTRAIIGSEVVMSTLGSWRTPKKDILTQGMKHIIPAMQSADITRLISLTGADARAKGDKISVLHRLSRFSLSVIAPKVIHDGEEHVRLLQESALEWTVIRSPVMNDAGDMRYVLTKSRPKPWQTINRQAVAEAITEQIEDTAMFQSCPYISRK